MKHILYILVFCAFAISCKKQTNNYAIISGSIDAALSIDSIILKNRAAKYNKTIAISNGTFRDTICIDKAKFFYLKAGKKYYHAYLENGFDLNIKIDKDTTNHSIVFSGKGSIINKYYEQKRKFNTESAIGKSVVNAKIFLEYSEQEYLKKVNTVTDSINAMLNDAKISNKNFLAFEKDNIFWYKNFLTANYHQFKLRKSLKDSAITYTPSSGFLSDAYLSFKPDNEDLFINSEYYYFITRLRITNPFLLKIKKVQSTDEVIRLMDSTYNTIDNVFVKDDFLSSISYKFITVPDQKAAKAYFDFFASRISNGNTKKRIEKNYNDAQERHRKIQALGKGVASPKFVDYENFAGGTSSLDDLKGKYVYIDVWATWCGPCKKEIPYLQKVEKKYHNKNIEFVSISVDIKSAQNTWKKMIKDMRLGGIQLFADDAFNSQFIKDYIITAIPRFILIDPNGNIVSSNAPRPSESKLIALFDELGI